MGIRDRVRKLTQVAVRRVAAEVYWAVGAQHEDNYAKNFILCSQVPRDADSEMVVAEIDKQAAARGASATRILREIRRTSRG